MARYILGLGSSSAIGYSFISRTYLLLSSNSILNVNGFSEIERTIGISMTEHAMFDNAAVAISTTLSPDALWFVLRQIESKLGRIRPFKNSKRTIDIDVLISDSPYRLRTSFLTVPHQYFFERKFCIRQAISASKKALWLDFEKKLKCLPYPY